MVVLSNGNSVSVKKYTLSKLSCENSQIPHLTDLDVQPLSSSSAIAHTIAGVVQTNIVIDEMDISGTLNACSDWLLDTLDLDEGAIGSSPYHYMALDLSNNDYSILTMVQISHDSTIINLRSDEDKKVIFEVKDVSKPVIVEQSNGDESRTQTYDISSVVLAQ